MDWAIITPGQTRVAVAEPLGEKGMRRTLDALVNKEFWISTTMVTRDLWRQVMDQDLWSGQTSLNDGRHPATGVGRVQVEDFLDRYSRGQGHRVELPTQAQWMRACIGQRPSARYYWDNGHGGSPDKPAMIREAKARSYFREDGRARVSGDDSFDVGGLEPNDFGLYDVHGLAAEWLRDRFDMADDRPYPVVGSYPESRGALPDDWWNVDGNCGLCVGGSAKSSVLVIGHNVVFLRSFAGPGDELVSFRLITEEPPP